MGGLTKKDHALAHHSPSCLEEPLKKTVIAITPAHKSDPQIAIAAARAGELGILDLGYIINQALIEKALGCLIRLSGSDRCWGVRWDTLGEKSRSISSLAHILREPVPVLILGGMIERSKIAATELKKARRLAHKVVAEVSSLKEAQSAQHAGYDAVIIKGHEAGGLVGHETSFILLQHVHRKLTLPYFVQGGIGLHTAAAAKVAGAAGVVLCEQLWLTEESPLSQKERKVLERLDGSETTCFGRGAEWVRCFGRSGHTKLHNLSLSLKKDAHWLKALNSCVRVNDDDPLILAGQEIAFAERLSQRFGTVGSIITAIRNTMDDDLKGAQQDQPLAPDSPLARTHNTRYPIVQGPMARISDEAAFCKAVAENGSLPFLGIGVMKKDELRRLLTETKSKMGAHPWGVGILGFLPPELRKEQIEIISTTGVPFAIIAGGHPHQAAELETKSIATYLHVPSPGLLEIFLKDGARKLIFEGRECGGHVGPLTSFTLWESAVQTLCGARIDDPDKVQLLFAGGIHDGLSAAMVSTLTAPLTASGMKIGVLMGTAYLFTEEAVTSGSIGPEYQGQAVICKETALLEYAPGHATRCAKTPCADEFNHTKQELLKTEGEGAELRTHLEAFNLGRLRVAAKGVTRSHQGQKTGTGDRLTKVDRKTQQRDGLFMMGQVASLHNTKLSLADLHAQVSEESKRYLDELAATRTEKKSRTIEKEDIAIVGMSCMFPEASNLREYWQNIINRVDIIREVSEMRWDPVDFFDPDPHADDKTYSKWGGFLGDIQFDPTMYGIPPSSLPSTEPIQLLALETAWQALKDAGYHQREFPRHRTSVVFGLEQLHDLGIDYMFRTMLMHYLPKVENLPVKTRQEIMSSLYEKLPKWTGDSFPGVLGNIVSGRVANRLNLGGSNFIVDAACASSLTAVEVAIAQLQAGTCDVALAGAVDGHNHAFAYLVFSKTYALSPRGRARPFDDSADGTVISEGVAVIVLKRLSDAERDGDHIYALIKGIGSSSDGRNRSLIAPHPGGETSALRRAYEDATVSPSTVELIEAHGTGTAVGDKVEIESLNEVFGNNNSLTQFCAVGSVKSMIGHCKAASGMAGIIKTVLSLSHKILPPTIGVEVPNSLVDFSKTPFYINTESRPWLANHNDHPRRAGVSAFGFGGTNFHVVLEEYTKNYRESHRLDLSPREAEVFFWIRESRAEMQKTITRLSLELENTSAVDLSQLAYSVFLDEKEMRRKRGTPAARLGIVATSIEDLRTKLKIALTEAFGNGALTSPQGVYYSEDSRYGVKNLCFLFPGQGSQTVNMLRDLILSAPEVYSIFELVDESLKNNFERPLSRYIYPLPVFSDAERSMQQGELDDARIAQPALAVTGLAAYDLLTAYGIEAEFMAGHSFGEYVALCAAGALSREDLITLSALRGRLVHEASEKNPGAMASVHTGAEETAALLKDLKIAATPANFNAPDQTVIAGTVTVIDQAVKTLHERGIRTSKIPVTAAFHSAAMGEVRKKLSAELKKITFSKSRSKVYSNTTARTYPVSSRDVRALLARHIISPIQFEQQIRHLYQAGARIFIEVGPGRILSSLVDSILRTEPHTAIPLEMKGRQGWLQLAHLLSHAGSCGLPVNMKPWFAYRKLDIISTEEVFQRDRAYRNPADVVWRINPGKASPWHLDETARAANSAPTVAMPEHSMHTRSNSQKAVPPSPPHHEQESTPLSNTHADPLLAQFQSNMTRLIELQQGQVQITERIIALQEGIVDAYRKRGDTPFVESSVRPLATTEKAGKPKVTLGAVSPAPVLPALPVTPPVNTGPPASLDSLKTTPGKAPLVSASQPGEMVSAGNKSVEKGLPDKEEFQLSLLHMVSERTGYPVKMLDLDLNMERDLGIDSIKLVEIVSSLHHYRDLLQIKDEEKFIDIFTSLKTLRSIVKWYESNRAQMMAPGGTPSPQHNNAENSGPLPAPVDRVDDLLEDPVQRFILASVPVPLSEPSPVRGFPEDQVILIVGDAPGLSDALSGKQAPVGYRFRHVIPGKKTRKLKDNRFEVNLSTLHSVQKLRTLIAQSGEVAGGIFNLMSVASSDSHHGSNNESMDDAIQLFNLIKVFESDLRESACCGGGLLVNFSCMDGQFGIEGSRSFPVSQAGYVGLLKTIAREWPEVRVKCFDLDLRADVHILSGKIWREITPVNGPVEVGLNHEGQFKIDLKKSPLEDRGFSPLPLDTQSVLVVTGGAYGITAEAAKMLAVRYQPQMILVGRTHCPDEESLHTRDLKDPQHLRRYLVQELKHKNPSITPAAVEEEVQKIIKARNIRSNLDAMRDAGARVEYHSLDVRDTGVFARFLDDIYANWGRIDGVVHGAGIVEDKLIKDKTPEQFSRVFETKVSSARILAERLRPETLKFLVFFSSVVGRFGNAGQADYSASNEVLNKLAVHLDRKWPARVVSINWGPWDSGMISKELRQIYTSKGIKLIPVAEGVKCFIEELNHSVHGTPEVVITRSLAQIARSSLRSVRV